MKREMNTNSNICEKPANAEFAFSKIFKRCVAHSIVAVVFLLGVGLLGAVGKQVFWQIARSPYLVRTEGEIIEILVEKRERRSKNNKPLGEYRVGFPVVSFQTETGETIVFTAQIGMETSKLNEYGFRVGNKLPVVYDPENKLPPQVDSPLAFVGTLALIVFGSTMTGVGLIYFKFVWRNRMRTRDHIETALAT